MRGAQGSRIGYSSTRITTATTTPVKATSGSLVRLIVEVALTGTVTINDAVGTKTILPVALPVGVYPLEFACAGKIELVTSAADRVVAVWE